MTNELTNLPGSAQDALTWANTLFNWVTTAPIELVGVLVCIVMGYALKMMPGFPSKYIPSTLFIGTVAFYAFALSPSRAPSSATNPQVFMGMIGAIVWFAAWMLHLTILKRFIDSRFLVKDDSGNTTFMTKNDNIAQKGP